MPVGGSRHYDGAGLGDERGWKCPSCGQENMGTIAQGCAFCGAGKPGRRVDAPPPAPPPATVAATAAGQREDGAEPDIADAWWGAHPLATPAEAYRAGYLDGVRAARVAQQSQAPPMKTDRDAKVGRTIVAALQLFAQQVLPTAQEEIASGEWLSVAEVQSLIQQLQEPVHA